MSATASADKGVAEEERAKPFPLLDLPPEIWSNIVKMAVDDQPAYVYRIRLLRALQGNHYHQPAITRTCRTVRQEALPYFYATHFAAKWNVTRHEDELSLVGRLLELAGERNREAVQGVRVSDDWAYEDDMAEIDFVRFSLQTHANWDFKLRLELCQTSSASEGGKTCTFNVSFL